jgi:L-seryl-tRNA(Ser) seleniumtransferase
MASESAFGGGTSPGERQASFAVTIKLKGNSEIGAGELSKMLRSTSPPVIARVQNEKVIVDFRTVPASDEPALLRALQELLRP